MLLNMKDINIDLISLLNEFDNLNICALISTVEGEIIHKNRAAVSLMELNSLHNYEIKIDELVEFINKEGTYKVTISLHEDKIHKIVYKIVLINGEITNDEYISMNEINLKTIFESVYDAIIIHDLQGNIKDVNNKMLQMYGFSHKGEVSGITVKDLSENLKDEDIEGLSIIWNKVLSGENQMFEWKAKNYYSKQTFDVEVFLARITLKHGDAILATVRDITSKKKTINMIRYLSFHDKLTGLFNRAFFEENLKRLDTERQLPLSIIIADVNGLKLTNDAFGHLAGDELLIQVGKCLKKTSRKEDIIARWGGDEFAVILPNTDLEKSKELCNRIVNECNSVNTAMIPLSISLGCATKVKPSQDIFDIIKEAETKMYSNKITEGKNIRQKIISSLLGNKEEWDHNIDSMIETAEKLAVAYGLDEIKINNLRLLITIHDIGKASIPKDILNKKGSLDDKEWEIVKKHSEIGYRIASTYAEYSHIAEDILSHHERWDGNGYPQGLKGHSIPILSRILSIVDAYDVITAGRPYKKPLNKHEALLEIKRNAGTQFDPQLVEIFLNIMK